MTTTTRPHPVYVKATQDGWIETADQAKLIRSTLAARFPGVRFYVRLERFAGGSAIDIYYDGLAGYEPLRACYCATGPTVRDYNPNQCSKCDYIGRLEPIYKPGAPTKRDVEAITDPYRGGSFDGTIDLGYSVQSWLLPDGRAVHGRSPGTVESRGLDPAYEHPRPEPGAVLVHFSAHFVHVHDEMPYGMKR